MNETIVDILIVEDNPNDAELTLRTLKKHHIANNIQVVTDGEEALDYLFCKGKYLGRTKLSPRVIFLDIKLPKLNGLEVLRAIKKDKKLCHIPIVMLTSSCQDPDINEAYAMGANSYVVKPVEIESFTNTINSLGMYWLVVNQTPKYSNHE